MTWGTPTGIRNGSLGHSANPTLAYSGAVSAGDTLFAAIGVSGAGSQAALTGVSDSVNGAWTSMAAMQYNSSPDKGIQIFYFPNSGAGTPTVTVNSGVSIMDGAIFIWRAAGGATSSIVDGTPTGTTGNSSVPGNASNYTPGQNATLVIAAYYGQSIASIAAQNGFTIGDSANPDGAGGWAYLIQTTAALATAPFSAPSTNWGFVMGGFKVAGAAATTWGPSLSDQWCRIVQGSP